MLNNRRKGAKEGGKRFVQVEGERNEYKLKTHSLTVIAVESPSLNARSISMMVHVFV
jgi:hypothetical protein